MRPETGQIVRVRSRQYLVERVAPTDARGQQTLVALSCLDDDVQGDELEVLWELEPDAKVLGGASWEAVKHPGFDAPWRFAAYLHAQRWNCVTSTDPKLFQAPYRAGIKIDPYQLGPAMPETLWGREDALLDEMTRVAEAHRYGADSRVQRLIAWIRENLCPEAPAWNARRVIVFTEYTDTQNYLVRCLREAFADTDDAARRIAAFHGGMSDEDREALKQAFNAEPKSDPLRVLVATDAAREGVNLQNHCADLFHIDVPWNPSRMEQRNGRIDRKLQRAPEVRCHYFVYTQRPEDEVLAALVVKTDTIRKELETPLVYWLMGRSGWRIGSVAATLRNCWRFGL